MTVATKGEKFAASITQIEPPAVTMHNVFEQYAGHQWREFLVRLPEGAGKDDLKDPSLWRKTQSRPGTALRLFDRLTIVAFDETWMAECRVIRADASSAVLSFSKIIEMGTGRFDNLPQDDTYKIRWSGTGYIVVRKSDEVIMSRPVRDLGQAATDMRRLHARAA